MMKDDGERTRGREGEGARPRGEGHATTSPENSIK
jgi:hypothetical protein